jgi:hypothetical protein
VKRTALRRKIALEGQETMAKLNTPPYPKPPRFLLVMLGSAVAFFIGIAVYTYVWPDKSAVAEVPGDHLPPTTPIAPYVYNVNGDKVGQIADVLLGNDHKVDVYILNVGDWFLDGSEKNIAVPSQKMTWVKEQNYETKQYEWTAIVSMTKADVQNAPKQIFDFDAKKWVPAQ